MRMCDSFNLSKPCLLLSFQVKCKSSQVLCSGADDTLALPVMTNRSIKVNLSRTVQYSAVQCSAVQCCTV